jgi:hypothetical protein
VWLAAHAACTRIRFSQRFPFVMRPLRRLPALLLFPGHIPAHDARWSALGNCSIRGPISASTVSATLWLTPGIVCNRSSASAKGAGASSMREHPAQLLPLFGREPLPKLRQALFVGILQRCTLCRALATVVRRKRRKTGNSLESTGAACYTHHIIPLFT